MTAEETRKKVKELYETLIGRNLYSQNSVKRQCVYTPYKDGNYYSDCSSSILNTYFQAGVIDWREGNTATIHSQADKADVAIVNGIPDEAALRVGDMLLFRGSDASRPEQIGHVELYAGNGVLYGHGSNVPSVKDMMSYCEYRERQRASNGRTKGLAEVRRFIQDDQIEIPIDGVLRTLAELNYRAEPKVNSEKLGAFEAGKPVHVTKKCNRWFYAAGYGWCSAAYLTGWVQESGRWWYLTAGYTYPAYCLMEINGDDYCFDRDGWLIESGDIDSKGAVKY